MKVFFKKCFETITNKVGVKINSLHPNGVNSHHLANALLLETRTWNYLKLLLKISHSDSQ